MKEERTRIAVTAATYNRPKGLTALLDGIASQELPGDVDLRVVIVDNSPDANARGYTEKRATEYRFPLAYYHETARGISHARNCALRDVLVRGDSYMASIDDDEVPDAKWIAALLDTIRDTGADAVVGTILPVFEESPPWWVEKCGIYDSSGFEDRQPVPHGYTSNALLDMRIVRRLGIEFDPEYALTGGEDTDFFRALHRGGGKTVYSSHAVAHETIVPARATFRWLTQFWFRSGNTDGLITYKAMGRTTRARLELLLRGVNRSAVGFVGSVVTAPLFLLGSVTPVKTWRILCRGVGYFSSSLGVVYEEYRNHNR